MNNFEQIKTYMAFTNGQKPRIAQGWLRVLVFVLAYFGITILMGVIVGLVLLGGNLQGIKAGTVKPGDIINSNLFYLSFLFSAIGAVITVWLFRKFVDKKTFESLGFEWNGYAAHAAAGFFIGIAMLCLGTLFLVVNKNLEWTDISFDGTQLFLGFGLMVIVAVYEELVFRGYILSNLLESTSKWMALVISAILFALFHAGNPGMSVVPMLNIFLAGLLLGINYIYTKNLWFSIALHFSWNFFQGSILGYEVSGLPLQSLFRQDLKGNTLLTGGSFGFEGSLLAGILSILVVVGLGWLYETSQNSKVKIQK